MPRFEFSLKQKREMAERSNGVCEAGKFGTYKMYGMADADICHRQAQEFDHIIADALKREPPRSADDGLHVCAIHHKIKTHGHDRPSIQKAKNIREKGMGIRPRNSRPLPGTKLSGFRKRMNGEVERW